MQVCLAAAVTVHQNIKMEMSINLIDYVFPSHLSVGKLKRQAFKVFMQNTAECLQSYTSSLNPTKTLLNLCFIRELVH